MVRRNGRPRFDGLKFHLVFHVTKSFQALWLISSNLIKFIRLFKSDASSAKKVDIIKLTR